MDFEPGWAILAGLIGGAAMAVILYMGNFALPKQMKMNLFMMLGTMLLPVGAAAMVMGAVARGVMSAVFGLIYGAVFAGLGSAVWRGALGGGGGSVGHVAAYPSLYP